MQTSLSALLLTLAVALGPDGAALRPVLSPPSAPAGLPLAGLAELAPSLWLVLHRRDDWRMAFYLPASTPVRDLELMLGPEGSRSARLLPGLALPRLVLYAPYYRPAGRWRPLAEMPVDVAEQLYYALLEGWLERAEGTDPGFAAELAERAAVTMAADPAAERLTAFRAAVAGFAASALSVAGEIARSEGRRRAAGRPSLCRLLDHPATLFGGWRRIFDGGLYPGEYPGAADQAGGRRRLKRSRGALSRDDKRWVMRRVLGAGWSGAPRHDFAWLCSG
ncbi:MAG: hypothetical protein D6696_15170 [Acidobacteria bacterium]|nr:MAG: hypothetical protein D6696_15170 [Acidobacteriota bacterium]